MLAGLTALLGFAGPWIPELLGWLKDKSRKGDREADREHEWRMYKLRLEHADAEGDKRTWAEAITAGAADAASARRYQPAMGIRLLDAAKGSDLLPKWILAIMVVCYGTLDWLCGTVRPVVTYAVVGVYLYLFGMQVYAPVQGLMATSGSGFFASLGVWAQQEQVLGLVDKWFFAEVVLAVVFFWFGQRTRTRFIEGR